jgi:hypothetical protein
MRRIGLAGVIGAGIMLGSATAGAQERGQFGLVMGYPTAVGAAWHTTDRVAIKAEATFSVTSSELDSGPFLPERDLSSSAFGIGIAGLFYAGRTDNVSLYFSPRFGYGTATSEIEDGGTFDQGMRNETSTYSLGGSFGVQYSPNRRVSVFGELGLNYATQELESSTLASTVSESSLFGVRSAVGIVLYFN